jgi:hypothetical protein
MVVNKGPESLEPDACGYRPRQIHPTSQNTGIEPFESLIFVERLAQKLHAMLNQG